VNKLIFTRESLPSKLGYNDTLVIVDEIGTMPIKGKCSTWPNPFRASNGTPYYAAYGAIDLGEYRGRCVVNDDFGKCILINNGDPIPAVWPNKNHEWKPIIDGVFAHEGGLKSVETGWRGSAGCLTIEQPLYGVLMDMFRVLEECIIIVRGKRYELGLINKGVEYA